MPTQNGNEIVHRFRANDSIVEITRNMRRAYVAYRSNRTSLRALVHYNDFSLTARQSGIVQWMLARNVPGIGLSIRAHCLTSKHCHECPVYVHVSGCYGGEYNRYRDFFTYTKDKESMDMHGLNIIEMLSKLPE